MLDVQQVRLRFIFVRALYLYCLFQKAYGKAFLSCIRFAFAKSFVLSERTRMSVVLRRSEFAEQTRRWVVYMDVHYSTVYFKRLTERLYTLLQTILNVSEAAWMYSSWRLVQMVSLPQLFCDFYILCLIRLPLLVIMCTALDNIQFIIFHFKDNKEF